VQNECGSRVHEQHQRQTKVQYSLSCSLAHSSANSQIVHSSAQGRQASSIHRSCSLWRSPPSSSCRSFWRLALLVAGAAVEGPGAVCAGVTKASSASCEGAWLGAGKGGVTSAMLRFADAVPLRIAEASLVCAEAVLGLALLFACSGLGVMKLNIDL